MWARKSIESLAVTKLTRYWLGIEMIFIFI